MRPCVARTRAPKNSPFSTSSGPAVVPGVAVDEEQLDVGGVAQGGAAHLAQAQHGVLDRQAGDRERLSVPGRERAIGMGRGRLHDELGEGGEPLAQGPEVGAGLHYIVQVVEEYLAVLEVVELPREGLIGLDAVARAVPPLARPLALALARRDTRPRASAGAFRGARRSRLPPAPARASAGGSRTGAG